MYLFITLFLVSGLPKLRIGPTTQLRYATLRYISLNGSCPTNTAVVCLHVFVNSCCCKANFTQNFGTHIAKMSRMDRRRYGPVLDWPVQERCLNRIDLQHLYTHIKTLWNMSTVVAFFYSPLTWDTIAYDISSLRLTTYKCGWYGYSFWPIWSFRVTDVVVADMVYGRYGTDPPFLQIFISPYNGRQKRKI